MNILFCVTCLWKGRVEEGGVEEVELIGAEISEIGHVLALHVPLTH